MDWPGISWSGYFVGREMGHAACNVYLSPELSGNGVFGLGLSDVSLILLFFLLSRGGSLGLFSVIICNIL